MHRNIEKKRVEEEKLVRNEAYKIFSEHGQVQ